MSAIAELRGNIKIGCRCSEGLTSEVKLDVTTSHTHTLGGSGNGYLRRGK